MARASRIAAAKRSDPDESSIGRATRRAHSFPTRARRFLAGIDPHHLRIRHPDLAVRREPWFGPEREPALMRAFVKARRFFGSIIRAARLNGLNRRIYFRWRSLARICAPQMIAQRTAASRLESERLRERLLLEFRGHNNLELPLLWFANPRRAPHQGRTPPHAQRVLYGLSWSGDTAQSSPEGLLRSPGCQGENTVAPR